MKRFLLATVALAALSAPAAAADLATKYPVKAVPVPVFSWTGFYIGGNFGYGGDKFNFAESKIDTYWNSTPVEASRESIVLYDPSPIDYTRTDTINSSGFFAGGQIGYNYQFANNVVIGIETDLQWSGIEGKHDYSFVDQFGYLSTYSFGGSVDYFGTIRARLGYAYDRFLPYITGGAAYGKTKVEGSYFSYDAWCDYAWGNAFDASSTNWGWTIGAGAEYAITNNWTIKAEYLYVDLGSTDYTFFDVNDDYHYYTGSVDTKFHTMKVGVNYKF